MAIFFYQFIRKNLELLFWITAIVILFVISPADVHFTLCPLSNLGFEYCPGCGLGHAIHYALWFDLAGSFRSHPLGIIALVIILNRIYKLSKIHLKHLNYE